MELELLAKNREAIPIIASWYYEEWGHLSKENTLAKITDTLHDYVNMDKIPLIVLTIDKGQILGASQLKYREMDIYPEKEHWLGGVYVSKNHCGKGITKIIIRRAISIATEFGVRKLYLQTERLNGGPYKYLGWQPIELVNYRGVDVLVMEKEICV